MTEQTEAAPSEPLAMVLGGTVDNGRRADARLPWYTGPVGIRTRGDVLELSFFAASTPSMNKPVEGLVDGAPVLISSVTARSLEMTGERPRSGAMRAVVLTARFITPEQG